ncbi:MAG TPA: arylsulfatase [Planctomycetes bacterium]|nr:arylsulfatase [Planctomycetota bacterium]
MSSIRRIPPGVLSAIVLAGALFAPAVRAQAVKAASRPNIVLIMADDMGYECVSSNGGATYSTPRIDSLAKSGIRFLNGHSQPICTPSRVQIMTGLYNNRNYIRFGFLDPEARTFGHVLKAAGYKTCIAGKWQLEGGLDGPRHFGFDEYCLWQLTRRPSRYANPGLEVNGKLVDYKDGEYGPDIVSDYLCGFIERNKDVPFFAYYPMILPHWPFEPTPDSPDYDKTFPGAKGIGKMKYFKDMVSYTDKLVGKLVDKLESLGLREKTLVIFTGDNGTYVKIVSNLNGVNYPGGKGTTRDNGTHVPLVASWPGTAPAGKVSNALVDFSDILPTLADTAGAELPSGELYEGVSLVPLLRGKPFSGRKSIYCWYHRNGLRGKESQHSRNQDFKLYSTGRYFNVTGDLFEKKPINISSLTGSGLTAYNALKIALATQLEATRKATETLKKRGFGGAAKKQGKNKNTKAKNAEKKQTRKKAKNEKREKKQD